MLIIHLRHLHNHNMNAYDELQQVANQTSTSQSSDPYSALNDVASQTTTQPQNVKLASGDVGDQSYDDYCQQFVEQVTYGKSGIFPNANDAWNSYSQSGQAQQGMKGIQPGDLVYFAPDQSNNFEGHTGIYQGSNKFVSATYNGVQSNDLNSWENQTGQQVLGYVKNPQVLPQIGGFNGSN